MGYIKISKLYLNLYQLNYVEGIEGISIEDYLSILLNNPYVRYNSALNGFYIKEENINSFIDNNKAINDFIGGYKNKELYNTIGNSLKYKPYEYQREVVDFILRKQSTLIVASCGAGKTIIGICAYKELKDRNIINSKALILVKASLKEQWKSEVAKFSDLKARILETPSSINAKYKSKISKLNKKISTLDKNKNKKEVKELNKEIKKLNKEMKENFNSQFNDDSDIYIVNYELLLNKDIKKSLKNTDISFIFADEIHMIGSLSAKRSKAAHELQADFKIGATATPITKNPNNIYSIFKFIKPDLLGTHLEFENRYLTKNFFGQVNGLNEYTKVELQEKIGNYIIKKDIADIGKQLPKLLCIPVYIDLDVKQIEMHNKIMKEKDDIKEQMKQLKNKPKGSFIEEGVTVEDKMEDLETKSLALSQYAQELADEPKLLLNSKFGQKYYVEIAENKKLSMLLEVVTQIIESGEKVVIFSRFTKMHDIIAEAITNAIANVKIAFVRGELNSKQRFEEVYAKFRDMEEYKVLIMSDAGAEGINASKAKYVIEYDLAKDFATQTQRQGRIQRADSIFSNVIAYQLIGNDSQDIRQQMTVSKKEEYNAVYDKK